ncbi:MAG TPA: hypothetical protein VK177_14285 [Flavobacteriales bacterium]|nr:hypothetical protein [Flavobacteriales bacterium]
MTTNQNPVKTKSKTSYLFTLLFGLSVFANGPAYSQVSVTVNIASQPVWGPVGYDYVEYYYLPAYEVYYYVPTGVFFYPVGATWVSSTYLPARYHVDLYNTYKVVINRPKPYLLHATYAAKYARFKSRPPRQYIIKNSNNSKYFVVKGHPKYDARFIRTTNMKPARKPKTNVPVDKTKTTSYTPKYNATPRKHEDRPPANHNTRYKPVPKQQNQTAPKPQNNKPRHNGHGNKGHGGGKHK